MTILRITTLFAMMILLTIPVSAADFSWEVNEIIDGDTIRVTASDFPDELSDLAVRLRGIDTPEKGWRAECESENEMSKKATDFVTRLVNGAKKVIIRDPEWGKWGGRVIADVIVDGKNVSDMLIQKGYARPYDGGTKTGWCD